MTTFVARFSNGDQLTRTSKTREYSHAWRVMVDDVVKVSGFAGDHRKAVNAVAQAAAYRKGVVATEIAPALIVPEGFEKHVKAQTPFRIVERYVDGREYFVKDINGNNRHARFAEQAAAETRAQQLRDRPGCTSTFRVTDK